MSQHFSSRFAWSHELVASLRSVRECSAVDCIRGAADIRSTWKSWLLPNQSALRRAARAVYVFGSGCHCVPHAGGNDSHQRDLWRHIRLISDWLDCSERDLSLSIDERARPLRRAAQEHYRTHSGPKAATAAGGVQFRRFL